MAEEGGRKVFVIAVFYFFSVCRGWLGRGESRFRLDGATRESQGAGGGGEGSGDGEWAKGEGRPGRESPVMVRVDGLVQGCA